MRLTRVLVAIVLTLVLFGNIAVAEEFAGYQVVPVTVDGQEIASAVPPISLFGTTMVPLRVVSEVLGANIAYNPTTGSVAITRSFAVSESSWQEMWSRVEAIVAENAALKSRLATAERTIASLTKDLATTQKSLAATQQDLVATNKDVAAVGATVKEIDDYLSGPGAVTTLAKEYGPAVVALYSFDQQKTLLGMGTGFIWTEEGYILTNQHVIDGAKTVTVVLSDGRAFEAEWFWGDPISDTGFMKIPGKDFPTLPWYVDPPKVEVGEAVMVIGNATGLQNSVTFGIVSGKGRTTQGIGGYPMLQVDAAINPGNSGGPVLNMAGELIGIATSKFVGNNIDNVGFAVPIEIADHVLGLVQKGKLTRPWLGIVVEQSFEASHGIPTDDGLYVLGVAYNEAAQLAGITTGDFIVGVNNVKVTGLVDFRMELEKYKPGEKITLSIRRGGMLTQIAVTLGEHSSARRGTVPFKPDPSKWWQGEF